jgi:hypothetical protein
MTHAKKLGATSQTAEGIRLREVAQRTKHWQRWGPYVSERAWGTVREDYSARGDVWSYFPHDHARARAYRWNEDGLAGICDRHQKICFAIALWNERDPILKERLFGLTGDEGNHGEDVKEYYFYLDSTPTHSYMRFLYKYPQARFPYEALVEESRRRSRRDTEFELIDTGVFDDHRYFDVVVEYAKADPEDIGIRITVTNRGSQAAPLRVLPTVWFRNTWSWVPGSPRPVLRQEMSPHRSAAADVRATGHTGHTGAEQDPAHLISESVATPFATISLQEETYGYRWLYCDGHPPLLFTDNDTNVTRLFGKAATGHFKDAINDAVVDGRTEALNAAATGTKAAADYRLIVGAGESVVLRARLTNRDREALPAPFDAAFDRLFDTRIAEADEFYARIVPAELDADARLVMRQAFAGLLWSKQFYHYVVRDWLAGDPANPPPPAERRRGRNKDWGHLYNADVISMPDKWEYPWYAAWDLAFHCVPLALVDPLFAKEQLLLLLREWYMHPNGQLPAYEWSLGDANPAVHGWAAWRVYKIDQRRTGVGDRTFLQRVFQKLLLNFTWWVNRKDAEGNNVFEGGFLGLDNIGVFDRSSELPTGGRLEQSDSTSWMAMYCLNMLAIALELARDNEAYEDVASKFWEHFLYIAQAMNEDDNRSSLWDETDGFYYDVLHLPDGSRRPLRVRSMVGLIPLFAVETIDSSLLARLPGFKRRLEWFVAHRPDLTRHVASMTKSGAQERRLLAIVQPERLRRILQLLLDESEFLSPHGVRAMSQRHRDDPYHLKLDGHTYDVSYEPGESTSGLFGGNSNWRGPVWFPVNYLLIEALQKFHHYFGDSFVVECPTGSGQYQTLAEVAITLSQRLCGLLMRGTDGRRPMNGNIAMFDRDANWRDLLHFHEYFDGDSGRGLGASHQTGWTALVAKLLQQCGGPQANWDGGTGPNGRQHRPAPDTGRP